MANVYQYSLVRVVPDARRGEWANVGVCVYLSDRVDVRIALDQRKLRAMAPTLGTQFLSEIGREWEQICIGVDAPADRQRLLSRFRLAHASSLAWFQCEAEDYEDQINSIMTDLVTPTARQRTEREPRLKGAIKAMLQKAQLFSDDPDAIHRHKVVAHFPIKAEANLFADFAAKNGVLHVTETIDFRVAENKLKQRHHLAAVKAITLHAAEQKHRNCKRHVIYAYHQKDLALIEPALNMLHDYAGHVFDAGDRGAMAQYVELTASALNSGLQAPKLSN